MEPMTGSSILAHDDSGGAGPVVVLLPGAGDLRSEYRFIAPELAAAGYRVVAADLPGHGDSAPMDHYGVGPSAASLIDLVDHLGGGPVTVVACSFAPAAAVWAATERPEAFAGLVLISPHLEADTSAKGVAQRAALSVLMRGPWAARLWARFYRSWYPLNPPDDLDAEIGRIVATLADRSRLRAVRETLVASRDGMGERIARLSTRSLVIFGSADNHFRDPAGEAASIAGRIGARTVLVDGAGHYPQVEAPEAVTRAVIDFLAS